MPKTNHIFDWRTHSGGGPGGPPGNFLGLECLRCAGYDVVASHGLEALGPGFLPLALEAPQAVEACVGICGFLLWGAGLGGVEEVAWPV